MFKRDPCSPAIKLESFRTHLTTNSPPVSSSAADNSLLERDSNTPALDHLFNAQTTRKLDQRVIPYMEYSKQKSPFVYRDTLTVPELLSQLQLLIDSVFDCQTDLVPDLQLQTHKLILRLEDKYRLLHRGKENRANQGDHALEIHSNLKQEVYQLQKELDNANMLLQIREDELERVLTDANRDRVVHQQQLEDIRDSIAMRDDNHSQANNYRSQVESLRRELKETQDELRYRQRQHADRESEFKQALEKTQKQLQAAQMVEQSSAHHGDRSVVQEGLGDTLRRLEDRIRQLPTADSKLDELIHVNRMLNDKLADSQHQIMELKWRSSRAYPRRNTEGEVDYQQKLQALKEKLIKEKTKREELESEYEQRILALKRKLEDQITYRDLSPSKVLMTKSDYSQVSQLQSENHQLNMKLADAKEKGKRLKEQKQVLLAERRDQELLIHDYKAQVQSLSKEMLRTTNRERRYSPPPHVNANEELEQQIRMFQQREVVTQGELKLLHKELENMRIENHELRFEKQHEAKSFDDSQQLQRVLRNIEFQKDTIRTQHPSMMRQNQTQTLESLMQDIRDAVGSQGSMNAIMDKLQTLESMLSIYNSNLVVSRSIPTVMTEMSPREGTENVYSFNPNQ